MTNMDAEIRWALFVDEYKDYEPPEIEDVLDQLMDDSLPAFFGDALAHQMCIGALENLGVEFEAVGLPDEGIWSIDIGQNEMTKLPIYKMCLALHAYAYFGIVNWDVVPLLANRVMLGESDLSLAFVLIEAFGDWFDPEHQVNTPKYIGFSKSDIVVALRASRARLAIDTNDKGAVINPADLAALVKLGLKSIQNLMASNQPLYTGSKGDGIPVPMVRSWLKTRKKFLWSLVGNSGEDTNVEAERSAEKLLQDVHFVPVAADGTWFSPDHQKNGLYIVGTQEDEQDFEDYLEALERLSLMEVPTWCSPTSKGRWTVTTGLAWTRKTSAELGI